MVRLANHVALASGGFLGFGSICTGEQDVIDFISDVNQCMPHEGFVRKVFVRIGFIRLIAGHIAAKRWMRLGYHNSPMMTLSFRPAKARKI